jgi:hypothetical protein
LTPPLALTQSKYALAAFGPSVKSTPGCCVTIAPRLIGVPVALTPGLLPHGDVLTVGALEPAGLAVELPAGAPALELLVLELPPQPAKAVMIVTALKGKARSGAGVPVMDLHVLSSGSGSRGRPDDLSRCPGAPTLAP